MFQYSLESLAEYVLVLLKSLENCADEISPVELFWIIATTYLRDAVTAYHYANNIVIIMPSGELWWLNHLRVIVLSRVMWNVSRNGMFTRIMAIWLWILLYYANINSFL